jgi:hypothetical protein
VLQVSGHGVAAFPGLQQLELSLSPRVCDESITALAACTALSRLNLGGCDVSDAALPALAAALPSLASLSLSSCQVIRRCYLCTLQLSHTRWPAATSSNCLPPHIIRSLQIISTLNHQHFRVRPDPRILNLLQGLRCDQLGSLAALTGLTELDVSLCRGVGEATLASLQGLQELRVLNASVCPSLTDAGLEVSWLLPSPVYVPSAGVAWDVVTAPQPHTC